MAFVELFLAFTCIWALYQYLTRNFDYWKERNVASCSAYPIIGSHKDFVFKRLDAATCFRRIYDHHPNSKIVGCFRSAMPEVVLRDLDLIRDVMVKDSQIFPNRFKVMNVENEPLDYNLLSVNGKMWKPLRSKVNPAFSSAKLKNMTPMIVEKGKELQQFIENNILEGRNEGDCDSRDVMLRFMASVVAITGFGYDYPMANESEFKNQTENVMHCGFLKSLKIYLRILSPVLYKLLGVNFYGKEVEKYFTDLTKQVIKERESKNVHISDFIDQVMKMQDEGDVKFTDEMKASMSFSFVVAGQDTVATTMALVLYELAKNPVIQRKAFEEMETVLAKHNNEITYEAIADMKYLEMVFFETLRKHPVTGVIPRNNVQKYTFSDIDVTIDANLTVIIPVMAIHYDPEYYPSPEKFDPERFTQEEKNKRHPMAFIPFGEGPRTCLGQRLGKLEVLIGVVSVLQKYTVEKCNKTEEKITLAPVSVTYTPHNGVWIKFKKRIFNE